MPKKSLRPNYHPSKPKQLPRRQLHPTPANFLLPEVRYLVFVGISRARVLFFGRIPIVRHRMLGEEDPWLSGAT